MDAQYRVDSIFQDEELGDYFAKCKDLLYDEEFEKYLGLPDEWDGKQNASVLLKDTDYVMSDEVRNEIMTLFGVQEFDDEESFNYDDVDFDDDFEDEEDDALATATATESFNLREALNRIDLHTDNRYDLLNLYEACDLGEDEKKALAKIVYDQDNPEVIYDTLNDRFVSGEEIGMPDSVKDGDIHEGFNDRAVEFYNGYIIAQNIAGEGWDIYSYDGAPGNVKKVYLEDEGYASIKSAKAEIDSWHKVNESINEDVNKEDLKAKLERAVRDFVVNTLGYDDEFVNDYIVVSVTDSNFYEGDPAIKCEVRTELDYEECSRLADVLNPIVEAEDKQAYFDMETSNVTVAYLRTDFSDDVVEERFVAEFAPIIARVGSMDELRKLYQDIRDSFEGVWTTATFHEVHELIVAKANELNGTNEDLSDYSDDELASIYGGDTKNDTPDGLETPDETEKRLKGGKTKLSEAPSATLSDSDLFDPSHIDLRQVVKRNADAEEKARQEKERQDRIAKAREQYKDLLAQVSAETDTYKALELLFEALVPSRGSADTIAGELVRATMRILYRDWNDGDKFFCGYGLETCGGSAQYLLDMGFNGINDILEDCTRYLNSDDAYTKAITEIAQDVVTHILSNPDLLGEPNNTDSREYRCDTIEENQPKFDYDFRLPEGVIKHMDAGNITDDEVIDILTSNLDSNHIEYEEAYYEGFDTITIYGLSYDSYEEVQRHYMYDESYWSYEIEEWDAEYGDPYDEDGDDDDDVDEAFKVGDRVKQAHTSEYNVGTVKRVSTANGEQYDVEWDYSEGPKSELVYGQDIAPYSEEDEKKGLYEEIELDRKNFVSLVKDREGYFVLLDGTYQRRIIADTDEEAIEKFRATLESGNRVNTEALLTEKDWDTKSDTVKGQKESIEQFFDRLFPYPLTTMCKILRDGIQLYVNEKCETSEQAKAFCAETNDKLHGAKDQYKKYNTFEVIDTIAKAVRKLESPEAKELSGSIDLIWEATNKFAYGVRQSGSIDLLEPAQKWLYETFVRGYVEVVKKYGGVKISTSKDAEYDFNRRDKANTPKDVGDQFGKFIADKVNKEFYIEGSNWKVRLFQSHLKNEGNGQCYVCVDVIDIDGYEFGASFRTAEENCVDAQTLIKTCTDEAMEQITRQLKTEYKRIQQRTNVKESVEDEGETPYTYTQVFDELKLETRNFTIDGDTIKYYYKSEAGHAEKILRRHYDNVTVEESKNDDWTKITFSGKKKRGSRASR